MESVPPEEVCLFRIYLAMLQIRTSYIELQLRESELEIQEGRAELNEYDELREHARDKEKH